MAPTALHWEVGVGFAFLLAAIVLLGLILRLLASRRLSLRSVGEPGAPADFLRWKRPRRRTAARTIVTYAALSVLLVALHHAGAWNAASIGFTRHESLAITAVAGVVMYYPLLYAYGLLARVLKQQSALQRSALQVTFSNLPRARAERCIVVGTICLLNPIVEEVIFRGLLVHQYALSTGNLPRALVLGAIVTALNHAYQGLRAAPFHLVFYGAAVTLMYSTYGLAAAIALHYAADAMPLLGLKEKLQAYRKARRAQRRVRTAR